MKFKVFLQIFGVGERYTVDSLQHLVLFVAAPVCSGNGEEFEGLEDPVVITCGPRHRSTNSPCLYMETVSPDRSFSISTL